MRASVYDARICHLGEGPLWHPKREQLFWCDILAHTLLGRKDHEESSWQFPESISCAGWIDSERLVVAGCSGLWLFNLESGSQELLCSLPGANPDLRSNDGRVDPWGGLWLSAMSKSGKAGCGAIYRYHLGEMRLLHRALSIPNSICFAPDRRHAYFSDTPKRILMRQALAEQDGWPRQQAERFIDFSAGENPENPDGAVCDAAGNIWIALWGAAKIAVYSRAGKFLRAIELGAKQVTCPEFGGRDCTTMFCTSATENLDLASISSRAGNGQTFCLPDAGIGLPAYRFLP